MGYIRAMHEVEGRSDAFLASMNSFVNNLFAIFSTSFVIFTIDPAFLAIALIPLFVSFFIGKAQGKARFACRMETQANEREEAYIRRIFYSKEYAEEMRTTGIARVLIRHFCDIMEGFQRIVRKHGIRMAFYEYLDYMLMDVVVYLGGIVLAIYKAVVTRTVAVSGALVVANTISSVSWSIRSFSDILVAFQEHAMYIGTFMEFLAYEPQQGDAAGESAAFLLPCILPLSWQREMGAEGHQLPDRSAREDSHCGLQWRGEDHLGSADHAPVRAHGGAYAAERP